MKDNPSIMSFYNLADSKAPNETVREWSEMLQNVQL
jgi:hypothetical protein